MRNVRQSVPQIQLVTFRVGGEEFGLDVFAVHEILRFSPVTPVPKAPQFVEGVLDVRGALVPVVDLRKRFEVAEVATNDDTRIVLVEFQGERLGLVVDAVTEVLRVPETAVLPPPKYVAGLAAEFIRGIVRMEGRLIVLVDMDRILGSAERIALQAAFAPAEGDAAPGDAADAADAGDAAEIDPGEVNAVPAAMMEGEAGAPAPKGRTRKG
ncbi:MAG TPA: chemotaxis protein CheW [Longimicrobiaceae bacterium]|nr:chemotaxis protein CheW [Longimicrobiaceae bacterium]